MNNSTDKAILTVVLGIVFLIALLYLTTLRARFRTEVIHTAPAAHTNTVRTTTVPGSSSSSTNTYTSTTTTTVSGEETVACTMDARQCPDGSYVGRTGPQCSFAPCP